jgi:hypothetical protein
LEVNKSVEVRMAPRKGLSFTAFALFFRKVSGVGFPSMEIPFWPE